jgi:hypothetical protein
VANKITVKRWNGGSWTTSGSGFSSGAVSYVQMAVGTGFGAYGSQYSVPYVAFCDNGGFRVRVHKPNGDTVGSQSLIDGQFGIFRLNVISTSMDGTPYLAFGDNTAADRVRVKKYVYNMSPYNWDTVGALAAASTARARDISFDGVNCYLLVRSSAADTLKRLNGTAWQTVMAMPAANHPTLYCNGTLYCADRDDAQNI